MKIDVKVSTKELKRVLNERGYVVVDASTFALDGESRERLLEDYEALEKRNEELEEQLREKEADEILSRFDQRALDSAENALIEKDEMIANLHNKIKTLTKKLSVVNSKLRSSRAETDLYKAALDGNPF